MNSLWPSDTIWWQRSGSTLAQVMACCLMTPSHYLNQCWLIISEVQWHSYYGDFTRDASTISHWNPFENYMSKIEFKFPRGQWVKNKNTQFFKGWRIIEVEHANGDTLNHHICQLYLIYSERIYTHDDIMLWKCFLYYWPLCEGVSATFHDY